MCIAPKTPQLFRAKARTVEPGQRVLAGVVHGVELGKTAARVRIGQRELKGIVESFASPFFQVRLRTGAIARLRGHALAPRLIATADDFYDPRLWSSDYSIINPIDIPGWRREFKRFVARNRVTLPQTFVTSAKPSRTCPSPAGDVTEFREHERDNLKALLMSFTAEMRAESTLQRLRNPTLRLLSFLASRHMALPPSNTEFAMYLAKLAHDQDNVGALTQARHALQLLGQLNSWPYGVLTSGLAAVPLEAMRRKHKVQAKKTSGLTLRMVNDIIEAMCHPSATKNADLQWEFAFGAAVCIGYKVLLRHSDLKRCRWDKDFCEVFRTHIRFYLSGRKNAQYKGNVVDIAVPADRNTLDIYHIARLAHAIFKSGHVLPSISASGRIDREKPMSIGRFRGQLRQTLMDIGVPAKRAARCAGHSARSGGATAAAESGLAPQDICQLAGVKDVNWLSTYNRNRLASRLRVSRALGL